MRLGVNVFIALSLLSAGLAVAAWVMAQRLVPEDRRKQTQHWLITWLCKGLLVPCIFWALLNLGLSWSLQPLMPEIQAAQNAGTKWWPIFFRVAGCGIFVVSSFWSAVTLGWSLALFAKELQRSERVVFKGLCFTSALGMGVVALITVLIGGPTLLGVGAFAIAAPIAGYAPGLVGLVRPRKMPPMYARAIAKLKFGKYGEAEWEIIHQLEKHEDDFQGWMMLAELYATHFNDMSEAQQTILEICNQPNITPSQLSVALHRLADWYLKLKGDPDAAHRALQMVADRLPGTHLARMALLRAQQLPRTRDELREQQSPSPVRLPALGDSLDEPQPPSELSPEEAATRARDLVERLREDPNNIAAREKLARLFAESLGRANDAIQQLELLLGLPEQPVLKRADWLSLIAAWHLRFRQDTESARSTLEQLLRECPHTPQALAAQRRLRLLKDQAGASEARS